MGGSRTVKTLTALFVSMTFGALALMVMETPPISVTAQPLAVLSPPPAGAAEVVYDTASAISRGKWACVVVHSAADRSSPVAQGCHFIIDRDNAGVWRVVATENWHKQQDGRHIAGLLRSQSIGVCVIGDFSARQPDTGQFDRLVELVNAVQEVCRIPADKVYLMSDLDARGTSPGRFFPAARFSARLLKHER
jgi:hypothetical protein